MTGMTEGNMMQHPGLPLFWAAMVWGVGAFATLYVFLSPPRTARATRHFSLATLPVIGPLIRYVTTSAWLLGVLKLVFLAAFLVVIAAGLFGTQMPRQNAATVLVWNIWWAGLIFVVLFLGSAWCAVCPWDTLANILVRHRLTGRASLLAGLNLKVPKALRNLWPALLMFVGLSWLELGVGITASPYETALLALLIIVLAIGSAAIFERKAFCRHFCPVGRTIGFYAQLAPVELRPSDPSVCANCTTLECYHGSDTVDPCPTHQVMGTMTQNTFCLSCGNCARACPDENVAWRLRSPAAEAVSDARPHWDEAGFMVVLMSLTSFHGLTMLPFWEHWVTSLAALLGAQGVILPAFSLLFVAAIGAPVAFYAAAVWLSERWRAPKDQFNAAFSLFAFAALPLAFTYHLAHNLNHLVREGAGFTAVVADPFGLTAPEMMTMDEKMKLMAPVIPQSAIWAIQAALMAAGFVIALRVITNRSHKTASVNGHAVSLSQTPLIAFAASMTLFNLWILMQPMMMRF